MTIKTDFKTFGFVGLGLIGGSIAHALREHLPSCRIVVYDIDSKTRRLSLSSGVATEAVDKIDEAFSQCDCIFLCAPVSDNGHNLSLLKNVAKSSCLLTDVGSVKAPIHQKVKELQLENRFIGGHPMAGSERFGFINSKSLLLQNAYYILTPCSDVPAETVLAFRNLIKSIGAIPLLTDAQKHDMITGAISHLPHVISASLVNLIKSEDTPDAMMKTVAAGGFKDITRISSSSPVMWQQICLTNRENIVFLLDHYIQSLLNVKKIIENSEENKILDFFKEAQEYRDSFADVSSGPIKKAYAIHVEIADQPGALSSVATLLAQNGISIKNIGITHNRERTDGALRIEFYQEESLKQANELLLREGYLTHQP